MASVIVATLITTDVASSSPPSARSTVSSFLRLLRHGANTPYTASFDVADYDFYQSGSIEVTNVPSPPGTKAVANVDGYASTLHTAYVYRGARGRLVQWIQSGSNVSACLTTPTSSGYADLQCSRASPLIPSNGYSFEGIGFVPTFVYQNVQGFGPDYLVKNPSIRKETSARFGQLTCLVQKEPKGPAKQTTCVNRDGFVVSWKTFNGTKLVGRATLISLSKDPTERILRTLVKPTTSLILPPI
jgi:hypothetical protein